MAKNLFAEGEPSESERVVSGASSGFTRIIEREEGSASWGPRNLLSTRQLPYDYAAAIHEGEVSFTVTSNRVMSATEASQRLRGLMHHCGVNGQADSVMMAFHKAILLAHAKNSSSIIQPARANIYIKGGSVINFYTDVLHFLGDDSRRFFRAYADMVRQVLREIRNAYEAGDMRWAEDIRDLDWIAEDRGLSRHKDLVAGSADACTQLTRQEAVAIRQSKATIFANITNMADFVQSYRTASKQPQITHYQSEQGHAGAAGPDY